MDKKDKLIIENFARLFNKIKRLDEGEVNEIDYADVYNKMGDVGNQRDKIDNMPTPEPGLVDHWIQQIEKDPEGRWPLDAVKKVKEIYSKHQNGEELSPEEKKLIRFRNKKKEYQAQRIKGNAGSVLGKRYAESSNASLPQYENQTLSAENNSKPFKINVLDGGKLSYSEDYGFSFQFKVKSGGYGANLTFHSDGSYGFYKSNGSPINYNFSLSDSNIVKDVKNILQQAKENYTKKA
jgi:hypothetical protein